MVKKNLKYLKIKIWTITVTALVILATLALIITNCFIPVKYIASYTVLRNGGAAEGVMRVRFVDVGFGDCTIIELPDGKNMLIDAADGRHSNTASILKYLNKSDIDIIDYLVCTSVKAEHCGGLAEILKYKKVNKIYMPYCENSFINDYYRDFTTAVASSKAEIVIAEFGAGEINTEIGYLFKFLSPSVHTNPEGEYADLNKGSPSATVINNSSAIMWLEYSGTSFLLSGDAEDGALNLICSSFTLDETAYPVNLRNCNIFKVPCHGSGYSACARLYDLIQPETAVISLGNNGYGYPSVEVLSNAHNYTGENLFRTDVNGTVTVEVTTSGYKVVKEKI